MHCWWECKNSATIIYNSTEFFQKTELTMWYSNSISGYIPKKNWKQRFKEIFIHTHVPRNIIHNSQKVEASQVPINR
jgi:hypothetical protein